MDKLFLKQIIIDQSLVSKPKHFVHRNIHHDIMKLAKTPHVIILSGIRRCGKSVVMQWIREQTMPSHYYINFDDDRLVTFQLSDFQSLIEVWIDLYGIENTFYFDEIQNIPGWERFVRRLHNEGKKVLITGSNANLLSRELGTHLTGRHITMRLFPFSFSEFLQRQNPALHIQKNRTSTQIALIKKIFSEFKKLGGFPEYINHPRTEYLQTLYENILYRDVMVRHKIIAETEIKELVYYLASNNAKEFTYNALRKLLGLASAKTTSNYCHYLEQSFLCFTMNRFSYSLKKQIQVAKKIYFIDPALAHAVGFRSSEDDGRTLENIVFLELLRRKKEVFFHKEKQECDFVIRQGYHIVEAIQVCAHLQNPKTKQREINGLLEAMQTYQLKTGLILTEEEDAHETMTHHHRSYQIIIKSCWRWLLE